MKRELPNPSEVFATIVREGLARGLLQHDSMALWPTELFEEAFRPVLQNLDDPDLTSYVEACLAAFPGKTPSSGAFVARFVTKYQDEPHGKAAVETILHAASDVPSRFLVSLRTIVGLTALEIHRRRFPLGDDDECDSAPQFAEG